jgi:hypothetical protein
MINNDMAALPRQGVVTVRIWAKMLGVGAPEEMR